MSADMAAMKSVTSLFSRALAWVRLGRGMSQEDFAPESGRTYISALERGLKQPTIGKVDALAASLEVHPLTLLALAYCSSPDASQIEKLFFVVNSDLQRLDLGKSKVKRGRSIAALDSKATSK